MAEHPRVRLADAITHFLLASIILLHVDTAEYLLLEPAAIIFSLVLAPLAAVIIVFKAYVFVKQIRKFYRNL